MKIKLTYSALLLALATWATPATASVRVYGEATSTGPSISVRVYADIADPSIVSHTFKLYYNASQLQVLAATRNEAAWYFHDGTRALPQSPPVIVPAGEVVFVSGCMDARNPKAGVSGNRVLLGTVLFARSTPNTPNFDLTIGRAGHFANFVTVDGTILEAQGGQVSMQAVAAGPGDQDLDGLADKWEEKFFGGIRNAYYSDDSDHDGASNLDEAMMGSDPTDPQSLLHLGVSERRGQLLFEWMSTADRVYSIEGSKGLGKFETLQKGIEATPPLNSLKLDRSELGDVMFFRIQVQPAESR